MTDELLGANADDSDPPSGSDGPATPSSGSQADASPLGSKGTAPTTPRPDDVDPAAGRTSRRPAQVVWSWRWPLAVFTLAMLVRLGWNLWVHPPEKFIYSDMNSYFIRAKRLLKGLSKPYPDEVFFPWGTHYLLAGCLKIFGVDNMRACGHVWATLSAFVPLLGYLIAGRLHGGSTWTANHTGPTLVADRVARISGLVLCLYYPLLSYTGYFLSETPFALGITLCAFFSLRLVDTGKKSDALLLGVSFALTMVVRPQIVICFGMLLVFAVWRHKHFKVRLVLFPILVAPMLLMTAATLRLTEFHSGRASLTAQNGALNRVFGRCHNFEIRARGAMFGPPALGALVRAEKRDPNMWLPLKPAMSPSLRVRGYVWEEAQFNELAERCIKKTGLQRQAYYAASHVVLLWGFHVAWPDMAVPKFRKKMRRWTLAHLWLIAPFAFAGMCLGSSRRWPRHGIIAMYLWSLLLTVMLVMGAVRFRVPYDALSIVLAVDFIARLVLWLRLIVRERHERRERAG